jgi:hypothetical protein
VRVRVRGVVVCGVKLKGGGEGPSGGGGGLAAGVLFLQRWGRSITPQGDTN